MLWATIQLHTHQHGHLPIRPYMTPQRVDAKSETVANQHSEFI